MNRLQRIAAATETLQIIERGWYTNGKGETVRIQEAVQTAIRESQLLKPADFPGLTARYNALSPQKMQTRFFVNNETTLQAASRLAGYTDKVFCLNFASAKNPGGGFLTGAQAQEESLARSSALYPCIVQMQAMYQTNRATRGCLYTDHMIYSPAVPVFRDDDGALLDTFFTASFLTAPAVNTGVVLRQEKHNIAQIEPVMIARLEKILSVALVKGYRHLVMGAWGCGVFQNDPENVAGYFQKHLKENPVFSGVFEEVVFAVLDHSADQRIIRPFMTQFAT
mgnify:CR=1 FL=1